LPQGKKKVEGKIGKEGRKKEGIANVPTCNLFHRHVHEIVKSDY